MHTVEVLDVGHGNCALISSKGSRAIVDAPLGNPLLALLRERDVTRIDSLVVSHADADHLGGVQALLWDEQIKIDRLYVNPEQTRTSQVWATFKVAAQAAGRRGTQILQATRDAAKLIAVSSDVSIEVLSPSGAEILAGAGGSIGEESYSANRLSVVVRVLYGSAGRVLLPADMDSDALTGILDAETDLKADVLVFPHHGGHSGEDPAQFASRLLAAVQPSLVVFSLGQRYANPIPDAVHKIVESRTRVCCTGLARPCEPQAARASSCAGSVTVDLKTGRWNSEEDAAHSNFVDEVSSPLCRRLGES